MLFWFLLSCGCVRCEVGDRGLELLITGFKPHELKVEQVSVAVSFSLKTGGCWKVIRHGLSGKIRRTISEEMSWRITSVHYFCSKEELITIRYWGDQLVKHVSSASVKSFGVINTFNAQLKLWVFRVKKSCINIIFSHSLLLYCCKIFT